MAQVTDANKATAARYIIRQAIDSLDVWYLLRSFARIPNVGETVVFQIEPWEYELNKLFYEPVMKFTKVVQVVHLDDGSTSVYCELTDRPFPEWAP